MTNKNELVSKAKRHYARMEESETLKPIARFLKSHEYRFWYDPDGKFVFKFQKRIDDGANWLCTCNDKLFMNVEVWSMEFDDKLIESVSMNMVHANKDNLWFDLKCYSMTLAEFLENHDMVFNKLVEAWQKLY